MTKLSETINIAGDIFKRIDDILIRLEKIKNFDIESERFFTITHKVNESSIYSALIPYNFENDISIELSFEELDTVNDLDEFFNELLIKKVRETKLEKTKQISHKIDEKYNLIRRYYDMIEATKEDISNLQLIFAKLEEA